MFAGQRLRIRKRKRGLDLRLPAIYRKINKENTMTALKALARLKSNSYTITAAPMSEKDFKPEEKKVFDKFKRAVTILADGHLSLKIDTKGLVQADIKSDSLECDEVMDFLKAMGEDTSALYLEPISKNVLRVVLDMDLI